MYDLVIIGSGPAGLSAAVYAKRACLDVVVLEKEPMGGGQMIYTQEVDNYLGLPETNGFDLAQKFEQHAKALEVPFISDEVDNVEKNTDGTWKITGASGTVYETKTVLLATGAGHRKLGVLGEETLAGFFTVMPLAGEAVAALVGLIPNCASSVVITELYLSGIIGAGAMMSGLLVNAGVGLLVLFRLNRDWKQNLGIVAALYALGVFWGIVIRACGIVF